VCTHAFAPTVTKLDYLSKGVVGQDAMISLQKGNEVVFTFGDTRSVSDGAGQTMISSAVAPSSALNTTDVFEALPLHYQLTASGIVRPALPLHISTQTPCAFGEPLAREGLNDSSVEVGALTSIGSELWVVFTKRPRGECTTILQAMIYERDQIESAGNKLTSGRLPLTFCTVHPIPDST
jgi:hypothetical protein